MQCEKCGRQINNTDIGFCAVCDPPDDIYNNRDGSTDAFYENGKYGLKFRKSGAVVVNPIFSEITEDRIYNIDLHRVIIEGKIYFVTVMCDGRYAMPLIVSADNLNDSKYLSKTGKILTYPIQFGKEYGMYGINGKMGIINKQYRTIIHPVLQLIQECPAYYSASFYVDNPDIFGPKSINPDRSGEKDIFFLKSKEYFSREQFNRLDLDLNDAYIEYWYYDETHQLVIWPILNGSCEISTDRPHAYFLDGKYGLVGVTGKKLTEPIYSEIRMASQCPDTFLARTSKKRVYLDFNGQEVQRKPLKTNRFTSIQRECKRCGHVWFSSVGDEAELNPGTMYQLLFGFFSQAMSAESHVERRNRLDKKQKLRRCPKCGCTDYIQLLF